MASPRAIAGLAALLALAAMPASAAPRLKAEATVAGPAITYGDVFEDAGALAGERLAAPAPAPGRRIVLSAADLAAAAQRLGIAPSSISGVAVTGAGTPVPPNAIADALRTAIQARSTAPKVSVALSNPRLEITAPPSWSGALRVDNLNYDERSGRFSATLIVPSADGNQSTDVTGRADAIVQVPVLKRPIAAGEIVGNGDIGWQDMPAPRASANIVLDPAALVGQAARHPLAPDRPLRAADVQKPVLVQKGSMVAMVVQAPGMVLTAIGRALQDGAIGDTIELTNPQSKRTVQGLVTGPGAVTIETRHQVLGAL